MEMYKGVNDKEHLLHKHSWKEEEEQKTQEREEEEREEEGEITQKRY